MNHFLHTYNALWTLCNIFHFGNERLSSVTHPRLCRTARWGHNIDPAVCTQEKATFQVIFSTSVYYCAPLCRHNCGIVLLLFRLGGVCKIVWNGRLVILV